MKRGLDGVFALSINVSEMVRYYTSLFGTQRAFACRAETITGITTINLADVSQLLRSIS